MNTTQNTESAALTTTTGTAGVVAATGVLTFALFPLALPILILTGVFVAPLLLIGVAVALPVVLVAAIMHRDPSDRTPASA